LFYQYGNGLYLPVFCNTPRILRNSSRAQIRKSGSRHAFTVSIQRVVIVTLSLGNKAEVKVVLFIQIPDIVQRIPPHIVEVAVVNIIYAALYSFPISVIGVAVVLRLGQNIVDGKIRLKREVVHQLNIDVGIIQQTIASLSGNIVFLNV